MIAYLDNSATTRVLPPVADIVYKCMTEDYGNPSSLHTKGFEAEKILDAARRDIAKTLKADEKEIFFTSGGTESNNLALIGAARANARSGKHIITTGIEHPSVYNPLLELEKEGFEITFLKVDGKGRIDLEELENAIRDDTILVSVMHVNNEIGTVEPVDRIGDIIKKKNKNILFHVDAIQSYGKLEIRPGKWGIDLLSVSGHKIHGPKGTGFLYIRKGTKIKPIIFGGGQQKDMRSGTENVPGIAGMAAAADLCYHDFELKTDRMYKNRGHFLERLTELDGVTVNGAGNTPDADRTTFAPHIISVSFAGIRAEVLLHALEEKGVYVSAGSACSSNHPAISGTLKAIGVKQDLLDSTLRFSLCRETAEEELDYAIDCLKDLVPVLRKYSRH